jgi:hypothetical protein
MAGNAHRSRPRNKPCGSDCVFCKFSKIERKKMKIKNRNGHRHNPAANKKQKR